MLTLFASENPSSFIIFFSPFPLLNFPTTSYLDKRSHKREVCVKIIQREYNICLMLYMLSIYISVYSIIQSPYNIAYSTHCWRSFAFCIHSIVQKRRGERWSYSERNPKRILHTNTQKRITQKVRSDEFNCLR